MGRIAHARSEILPESALLTAGVNGDALLINANAESIILEHIVSSHTDGTFQIKLQESSDKTVWHDVASTTSTGLSGNGRELVKVSADLLQWLRVVVLVTGSPATGAKNQVNIHFTSIRK